MRSSPQIYRSIIGYLDHAQQGVPETLTFRGVIRLIGNFSIRSDTLPYLYMKVPSLAMMFVASFMVRCGCVRNFGPAMLVTLDPG